MVEETLQRPGRVVVELAVLGALVGEPVAGLIDGQYMEALGQHRDVPGEVRPARRAGATAVQQHDRLIATDAGFVVVQLERSVDVDLDEPGGGLESQFFGSRHLAPLLQPLPDRTGLFIVAGAHQTMVSPGGNPNSWLPKIW